MSTDTTRLQGGTVIRYLQSSEGLTADDLRGFFEGWPDPPSPATHLRILRGSDAVVLAVDDEAGDGPGGVGRIVGFVTAVTDGVLAAYLPLLEVLPAYRGRGIGRELVRRVVASLGDLYMVDLVTEPHLLPFYASLGFAPATGAAIRRRDRQTGLGDEG